MPFHVYITASRMNGTLYTGVTNDLARRIHEHRTGIGSAFCKRHRAILLVYYETFEDPQAAISAEKRIKRWQRSWKIQLIERFNPDWRDLYLTLNE
ncbi:GIY-YIG nuclease family protein [Pannonibacter phragmitetus]|uniref:GIY-YIG nuclease family protein n=1 Tax=Pannonibacter phragmitetus TaxID=121719 RepID=UPI003D2E9D29